MGTLLKVGEQVITTHKNLARYPVPYSGTNIGYNWYVPNPDPLAVVTYMLDQLDGPTSRGYGQYLEDYARVTVPVTGTGESEEDPLMIYPYPFNARQQVLLTASAFQDNPFLNLFIMGRIDSGATARISVYWYDAGGTVLWNNFGDYFSVPDTEWHYWNMTTAVPPQEALDQVASIRFGLEVSNLSPSKNFFDLTGLRVTPVKQMDLDDFRGAYWDGSTAFGQASHTSAWDGTPRTSISTLTVTEISLTEEETENQQSISVTEDVTGLDASAISGGTAQATLTIDYSEDIPNYLGLAAEMRDTQLGEFYGKIRGLAESSEAGTVTVTADESLSLLNAWVSVKPLSGTLSSVLRSYVAQADAPIRPFTFQDGLGSLAVNAQGFVGNLYDKVRELLAAYGAELVTIGGVHVVRKPLQSSVVLSNFTDPPEVPMNIQDTAEFVRVHWYDNQYLTNREVYPLAQNPGESDEEFPEPTVYSVAAGETLTVDIQVRASLLSVNTPSYVAFVPDQPATGNGVYTAVGSDNLPITPSQWSATGGRISVRIDEEDPSNVKVTFTGPNIPGLSPFRIAMSSGSGNYYNALRLTGTGIFIRDQFVDLATGALPSTTGQKQAVECTNPYISTRAQAYRVGQIIAGRVQQQQDISFTIPTPTDEPVLGLLPGKKFVHANRQFRIETTTVDQHTISGTGTYALTVADYNKFFTRGTPFTVADFDALYAGRSITALNFSLKPLLHRFVEV